MIEYHDEIKEVLTKPDNYFGSLNDWIDSGYGPTFMKHRDSDQLDLSNYHTVEDQWRKQFVYGLDFVTDSANHWAVGWIEQIVVRVLDCKCGDDVVQDRTITPYLQTWMCETCDSVCTPSEIFLDAIEIKAALSDYPVLDEEDYSRREYEDMMQWLEQEVGEGQAPELFDYLYNEYSASRPDDVKYEWIEEWKEQNVKADA